MDEVLDKYMSITSIEVKVIPSDATVPTKAHSTDAGFDLYAYCPSGDVQIEPHQTVKIGTGCAIAIPIGYFGGIYARSGLATKQGLRPANCCGIIDSDYRGEIIVALHNDGEETKVVKHNDRIAQLIIQPFLQRELKCVDKFKDAETERGDGGFGSSGD